MSLIDDSDSDSDLSITSDSSSDSFESFSLLMNNFEVEFIIENKFDDNEEMFLVK